MREASIRQARALWADERGALMYSYLWVAAFGIAVASAVLLCVATIRSAEEQAHETLSWELP